MAIEAMITVPYYKYWVEFIDHDGVQKSMYLHGQSVEQIKVIIDDYEVVVIDNTETNEPCYWGVK